MSTVPGTVMTADGPIDPAELGITLTHEHILFDMSVYCEPPANEAARELLEAPLTMDLLGKVRRDPMRVRDNTILDEPARAGAELREFAALGGKTVVDVSPNGVRRGTVAEIAALCRDAGLQLITSSAFYIQGAHPTSVAGASVEAIAEAFVREAVEGHGDSGIRSGMIGEIGVSEPAHPDEMKVLDAACRAQVETGLPMCVHPYFGARSRIAPELARFVLDRGVDPSKFNLCHMESFHNLDYQRQLLDLGVYISFDTFGLEVYYDGMADRNHNVHDSERVRNLIELIELGYGDQMLISQDVCFKQQTKAYGGYGYAHILENIVPSLLHEGLEQADVDRLLIDNPRRYLTAA